MSKSIRNMLARMATKSQHEPRYRVVPPLLRALREEAPLTQRAIGDRLQKPQSWVFNCESANRRVDVTEFIAWAEACGVAPQDALARLLTLLEKETDKHL